MSEIKITARRLSETRHSVCLDQFQLHSIVVKAVAEAAGVDLDDGRVTSTRCFISSRDSSTGPEKYAEVEIVVAHMLEA